MHVYNYIHIYTYVGMCTHTGSHCTNCVHGLATGPELIKTMT